jgi:hypothetical protein
MTEFYPVAAFFIRQSLTIWRKGFAAYVTVIPEQSTRVWQTG